MAKQPTRKKKGIKHPDTISSQSLTEFRAWLSGVEEMQDEDWAPNVSQWALIRKRIGMIEDFEDKTPSIQQNIHTRSVQPIHQVPSSIIPPQLPTSFDNAEIISNKVPSSAIPDGTLQSSMNGTSVKTPDIDSGPYTSGFS
jgi:hypothetical protein